MLHNIPLPKPLFDMVAGKAEFTKLITQDPESVLCFLAEDDLLSNIAKYPYVKQILKQYPRINYTICSTLVHKEKVCAAILAVARFQILKKQEEVWPDEYVTKTKMTFDSFKEEYKVVSQIATLVGSMLGNQQLGDIVEMQNNFDNEHTMTNGVSFQ